MTSPLTDVLLVAHVVAVVISYGALGATGLYAHTARTTSDPFSSETLRRYFRPGQNVAGYVLFAVPLLGGGLLFAEGSSEYTRAYPWIGLVIWTISIAIAEGTLWPAERALQQLISTPPVPGTRSELRERSREAERAAATLTVLFVCAVVVMIARV